MPIKTRGWLFQRAGVEGKIKQALKAISKEDVKQIIVNGSILLGQSPVEGERFPKYSKSYKKAIKQGRYAEYGKSISPVNLMLSGKMLDSFFIKVKGLGLVVGFKSKIAKYHTVEGAGKSKVIRKMLPVGQGETFKRKTRGQIIALVQKEINRILKK